MLDFLDDRTSQIYLAAKAGEFDSGTIGRNAVLFDLNILNNRPRRHFFAANYLFCRGIKISCL